MSENEHLHIARNFVQLGLYVIDRFRRPCGGQIILDARNFIGCCLGLVGKTRDRGRTVLQVIDFFKLGFDGFEGFLCLY